MGGQFRENNIVKKILNSLSNESKTTLVRVESNDT